MAGCAAGHARPSGNMVMWDVGRLPQAGRGATAMKALRIAAAWAASTPRGGERRRKVREG